MVEAASRTACAPTAARAFALLSALRLDMGVEQRAQAEALTAFVSEWGEEQVFREHRLSPRDRPDFFLTGGIVVELKGPRHRQPMVQRQLERYAAHPEVTAIILATARAMTMPPVLAAAGRIVPVRVIHLGRAWL